MLKQHIHLIKSLLFKLFMTLFTLIRPITGITDQSIREEALEEPAIMNDESAAYMEVTPEPENSVLEKIQKWEAEYYYATKVWERLIQEGFSQAAACGIIGNMMVETAGSTLDLIPNIYSSSGTYYGLCQWSLEYYPETKDLSFEPQLEYLLRTMPQEFSTFGGLYKEGFTYKDFITLEDPREAALVFAKVYERCSSASYNLRQEAAIKAYNYFDLGI